MTINSYQTFGQDATYQITGTGDTNLDGKLVKGQYNVNSVTRPETFTAAATGTAVSGLPAKYFALQVKATGTVTSWTVIAEGSLDGTNWTTIVTHTNASGDGAIVTNSTAFPALYYRTRCTAIVLGSGTNIKIILLAMA